MFENLRVRVRSYRRRLTRRVAQVAWALGGAGIAALFVNGVARDLYGLMDLPLASIGLWLAFSAVVLTLVRVVFSGLLSLSRSMSLTETEEGLVLAGKFGRTRLPKEDILGVLTEKDRVWLLLSRGRLIALQDMNEDTALTLEERFDGGSRIRLEPEAKGWNALASLAAFGTLCLGTGVMTIGVTALLDLGGFQAMGTAVGLVVSVFGTAAIARVFRGKGLELGRDGILIDKEFFAYNGIREFQVIAGTLAVRRKDGKLKCFRLSVEPELAAAITRRVHDRMKVPEAGSDMLSRAPAESFEAWVKRLRGLLRAEGFREKGVGRDELKGVLQSASTPSRVRIAAAVALAVEERGEVEALLEQSADPMVHRFVRVLLDEPEAWVEELEGAFIDTEDGAAVADLP